MNKKQIKVKLGRLGVTDKYFKSTNWEKLYPIVNEVTSYEDVFLDIGDEGGFIMATFFSKKLSKSIVLTWDFSADDIDDLAEELESLIKEARDLENQLPDLSPCAYINFTNKELCEIANHLTEKECKRRDILSLDLSENGELVYSDTAQEIFNETYYYLDEVLN